MHIMDLENSEEMDADRFSRTCYLRATLDQKCWAKQVRDCTTFSETMISVIYAMELHRDLHSTSVPFSLVEARKRLLATTHKSDKNVATLFGRSTLSGRAVPRSYPQWT
ncbi:hypothetical protein TMatcc_001379 [Talaromyces marneffei ATCC 18224]